MSSFFGFPYPVTQTPMGFLGTQRGMKLIKSDILALLLTNPGERCMLPTYGVPLRTIAFEPNDPTVAAQVKQMIITAIATWEPRVVIQSITVTAGLPGGNQIEDNDHVLSINISFYDPETINQVQNLVLQVPLSNSGASPSGTIAGNATNQGTNTTSTNITSPNVANTTTS